MAKKIYAVKAGRSTGIFYSWDECKKQIDGFSGAVYKSFLKPEDAEAYLKGTGSSAKTDTFDEDTAVAYVDGSFRQDSGEFSCGAVLFYKGKEYRFSKKFSDPEMAEMRNVAGEIMGSVSVIKFCIQNNIKKLAIYHDYEGVARWATGEWKANKEGTRGYAAFCREARQELDFTFVKVKGHSGDKYNDLADALAKKALGI